MQQDPYYKRPAGSQRAGTGNKGDYMNVKLNQMCSFEFDDEISWTRLGEDEDFNAVFSKKTQQWTVELIEEDTNEGDWVTTEEWVGDDAINWLAENEPALFSKTTRFTFSPVRKG